MWLHINRSLWWKSWYDFGTNCHAKLGCRLVCCSHPRVLRTLWWEQQTNLHPRFLWQFVPKLSSVAQGPPRTILGLIDLGPGGPLSISPKSYADFNHNGLFILALREVISLHPAPPPSSHFSLCYCSNVQLMIIINHVTGNESVHSSCSHTSLQGGAAKGWLDTTVATNIMMSPNNNQFQRTTAMIHWTKL